MLITLEGIVTLVNLLHPLNAEGMMFVTLDGIVTLAICVGQQMRFLITLS